MITVEQKVKLFADNGYNPIHIFGNWYFIRRRSRNYCKISIYELVHLKEEE